MLLAAGQPPKVVSEILGHSTVAFTMDVYAVVAEELAEAAAVAIEAFVPRRNRSGGRPVTTIRDRIAGSHRPLVPVMCQHRASIAAFQHPPGPCVRASAQVAAMREAVGTYPHFG